MAEEGETPKRELADAVQAYLSHEAGKAARVVPTDATATAAAPAIGRPVATSAPPAGKQELAQAYDRMVEHESSKPRRILVVRPEQWRRHVLPSVIALGLAFIGYVWAIQPGWLFPQFDPNAPTALVRPEHELIAIDALIEQYRLERGLVPQSLEPLGIERGPVSLIPRASGGYQLVTKAGTHAMVLDREPDSVPVVREVK